MEGVFRYPRLDDGSLGRHVLAGGGLFCRYLGLDTRPDQGKRPLLILHGLFGSGANWLSHAGALARHRPVLLFDLDGHDGSRDKGAASYMGMLESLEGSIKLVKDAGFPSMGSAFHLLGHSMGGKLAMLFALRRPDSLASVVVADIAPKSYLPHHPGILKLLEDARPETWQDRRQAQARIAGFVDDPGEQAFMVWNLKPRAPGGFEWKFDAPGLRGMYPEIISWPGGQDVSSPVPGLFLRGGRSEYVDDGDMQKIMGLFPRGELATIPDAGHWIHVDQKDAFLRHTEEYLYRMDQ